MPDVAFLIDIAHDQKSTAEPESLILKLLKRD